MAQQSQFATALIDETVQTFNGGTTIVSPTDGVNLIENWISALHSGDESVNPIAHTLSELKLQLQDGTPNSAAIESLIQELAEQTQQAVSQTDDSLQQQSLTKLADALRGFGQQISGNGSVANQAQQSDSDELGASGAEKQDGGSYGSGYGTGN